MSRVVGQEEFDSYPEDRSMAGKERSMETIWRLLREAGLDDEEELMAILDRYDAGT